MELRDGELLLRPPTDADVPAVVDACQDEELSRFIPGFPKPYRERDARGWIASRNPRDEASKAFLIVNATSGELLGAIEVRLGEVGSIGYWIANEARGRSVATRATRLLAEWAVTEGGVQRLELTTHPDNQGNQHPAIPSPPRATPTKLTGASTGPNK